MLFIVLSIEVILTYTTVDPNIPKPSRRVRDVPGGSHTDIFGNEFTEAEDALTHASPRPAPTAAVCLGNQNIPMLNRMLTLNHRLPLLLLFKRLKRRKTRGSRSLLLPSPAGVFDPLQLTLTLALP